MHVWNRELLSIYRCEAIILRSEMLEFSLFDLLLMGVFCLFQIWVEYTTYMFFL